MASQPNNGKPAIAGGPAPGINSGATDTSRAEQQQANHGGERQASHGGDKVVVCCNLPAGMRLRVFRMVDFREPAMGGVTRESKIAERVGEEDVIIHGSACSPDKRPKCIITESGYALTPGVDRDTWEAWLEQNKNQPYVKRRMIYAMPNEIDARDSARELVEVRSGLEPLNIDPSSDPRVPRPAEGNVGALTVSDDNKAKPLAF